MKKILLKIKEFIEKKDNLFVAVLIIFATLGITLNVYLTNDDELWGFQNIYKMYNGLEIYSDANVIITPLFFIIGEWIFKLLGANILTYRIYNILIIGVLYFITYLLLKKIGITKKYSAIIILILMSINQYSLIRCQANYNTLALGLYILGIYLNLKKSKYNSFFQAIICFLIYFSKQNIAVFYGVGLIAFEIFSNKDLKEKIKELLIEFVGFGILVCISWIAMKYIGILNGFINYTILGIKEFAIENIYVNWLSLLTTIVIFGITLTFSIFLLKRNICTEDEKNKLILLNAFAYPIIFISFPIMNSSHTLMGLYVAFILLIYIGKKVVKEFDWNINEKITNIVMVGLVLISISYSIYHFKSWENSIISSEKEYEINEEHPFYGGVFQEGIIENIKIVTNYIENSQRNVIVFSNKAAFYMVPLKKNNGDLDLPHKGNFGVNGEQGIVEKIEKMKNTEFLIEKNDENVTFQESVIVRNYIKENFEKIGEVEEFEIYINKAY